MGQELILHLFGTERRVTAENFITCWQVTECLLNENLTLAGILRENEPDIPNILIRGEGREVFSSLSAFHGNVTLASCAKEKYQGCLFFHLSAIRNHAWVKAK
jgi:hypothetical protein